MSSGGTKKAPCRVLLRPRHRTEFSSDDIRNLFHELRSLKGQKPARQFWENVATHIPTHSAKAWESYYRSRFHNGWISDRLDNAAASAEAQPEHYDHDSEWKSSLSEIEEVRTSELEEAGASDDQADAELVSRIAVTDSKYYTDTKDWIHQMAVLLSEKDSELTRPECHVARMLFSCSGVIERAERVLQGLSSAENLKSWVWDSSEDGLLLLLLNDEDEDKEKYKNANAAIAQLELTKGKTWVRFRFNFLAHHQRELQLLRNRKLLAHGKALENPLA